MISNSSRGSAVKKINKYKKDNDASSENDNKNTFGSIIQSKQCSDVLLADNESKNENMECSRYFSETKSIITNINVFTTKKLNTNQLTNQFIDVKEVNLKKFNPFIEKELLDKNLQVGKPADNELKKNPLVVDAVQDMQEGDHISGRRIRHNKISFDFIKSKKNKQIKEIKDCFVKESDSSTANDQKNN